MIQIPRSWICWSCARTRSAQAEAQVSSPSKITFFWPYCLLVRSIPHNYDVNGAGKPDYRAFIAQLRIRSDNCPILSAIDLGLTSKSGAYTSNFFHLQPTSSD